MTAASWDKKNEFRKHTQPKKKASEKCARYYTIYRTWVQTLGDAWFSSVRSCGDPVCCLRGQRRCDRWGEDTVTGIGRRGTRIFCSRTSKMRALFIVFLLKHCEESSCAFYAGYISLSESLKIRNIKNRTTKWPSGSTCGIYLKNSKTLIWRERHLR